MSQTHIHHVIPRSRGGTDDPENLVEVDFIEHAKLHAEDFLNGGPRFDFRHPGWSLLEPSLRKAVLQRAAEDTREKNLQREVPCAQGCTHSEESRKARSERLKGPNNPMYGRKVEPSRTKRAQQVANNIRYLCLATGKVTTLGPLVQWQKARDIHPSLRISLPTLFFILEKSCLK
jgi:hypothetical protein